MYQVYKLRGNVNATLSLLSLRRKRKMKCYNRYLSMDMCFILKNMGRVERHMTMRLVLRDRLLVSLKLIIMGN
jgi:hypothetical protein